MRRRSLLAPLLLAACRASTPSPDPPDPMNPMNLPDDPDDPTTPALLPPIDPTDDPHAWLEEVTGDDALAWVRAQNRIAEGELASDPGFEPLRRRLLGIYDSEARIPYVSVRRAGAGQGEWLYNFWRDASHPRGLWRRTTLAEYRQESPRWEVLLDLDALAAAEGENWVWAGARCLYPDYDRCLVELSRGGADATVVREFAIAARQFVADGFVVPEAKTRIAWKDRDTVTLGTDFGPGSLTTAGYPRIVKEWRRGTPLSAARELFAGEPGDVAVSAYREHDHGRIRDWVVRSPSFFTEESFLRRGDDLERIAAPEDATVDTWDDQLLITLRSDWTVGGRTWPAGALLIAPLAEFRAGARDFAVLFEPRPGISLDSYAATFSAILVVELEDVKSRVYRHTRGPAGWRRTPVEIPDFTSAGVAAYDADHSDDYWLTISGFTTPTTLALGTPGTPKAAAIKANPEFFAADGLVVSQHFATSADGTRVPYFQIAREGAAAAGAPTILYGYGGFEVSLTPAYGATSGAAWLERGGVMVVANIRGGGEYGPAWHRAALREGRQRAYDDFIAVAEELLARGVTSPPKLGILGGSNGGLLVGVALTQRPELFGAAVSQVPLLDMRRYHRLLAGASWVEEYGDPDDPEAWAWLAKFSPYHNLRPGVIYPRTLFTTSTRDDRVHPSHARKMVARMQAHGADVLYYENIEGGHGGAADNRQAAYLSALAYTFFARELGL